MKLLPFQFVCRSLLVQQTTPTSANDYYKTATTGIDQYLEDRAAASLQKSSLEHDVRAISSSSVKKSQRKVSTTIERLLDPASAKGYVPLCRDHLNEEILVLLGAGNDTTSNAMILGMYHICRRPEVQRRLEAELEATYPRSAQAITFASAKQLPYLVSTQGDNIMQLLISHKLRA